MTALLCKNRVWKWTDECEQALNALKNALVNAPILTCPDFSQPFVIQTDASAFGIGAVLVQKRPDNSEQVISYISRSLSRAERNYSTTERECLAVVWAVEKLRPYVEGYHFTVVTDHHSLVWLFKLPQPTGRLARWIIRLQQFDFELVHRKGKDLVVPDLLSRSVPKIDAVEPAVSLSADQQPVRDKWYIKMLQLVTTKPLHYPKWRVQNGILFKYVSCAYPGLRQSDDYWKIVVAKPERT